VPLPLNAPKRGEWRLPELRRSQPNTTEAIRASSLQRYASRIATEEGRFSEAADLLFSASTLQPADPVYPLLAGLMLFRSAPQQRDRDLKLEALHRARMLLDEAGARGPGPYHALSSIFFAGGISISSAGARTGRGR